MNDLDRTLRNLIDRLLSRRAAGGWWEGYLSSSALSTATAVSALKLTGATNVRPGLEWLARNQNSDGGWGDTVISKSNISTTILCWCCFDIAEAREAYRSTIDAAEGWLRRSAGGTDSKQLVAAILRRYGNDRTFSVPILTVMAIAGRVDWSEIPQLPFEWAAMPHQLFGWLRLPVVSYALPALIAIGQVRHHHRPSMLLGALRNRLIPGTLDLLRAIQPSTGGYLEATPLTSFVGMSLASAGRADHPVVREGVRFLRNSMRADGSWPIDTNLSTWVTTLAVSALAPVDDALRPAEKRAIRDWLLAQQYREEHPYTHAAPGGWAWTPLPGGVPDADDTPGALLALRHLGPIDDVARDAATKGVRWLLDLQNSDGGMPTFCRGWGKLPFDRSGADLTAHALSAWNAWLPDLPAAMQQQTTRAIREAKSYLAKQQRAVGSWVPLWFGNEDIPNDENPIYGTARVLMANPSDAGVRWLKQAQNDDGSWGSSIEETALAVHALAGRPSAQRGVEWLICATELGTKTPPKPIGLYFASLWYFEELYPLIFSIGALSRVQAVENRL